MASSLPRRQDRPREPAWHSRERQSRADARALCRVAAACARLSRHRGSELREFYQYSEYMYAMTLCKCKTRWSRARYHPIISDRPKQAGLIPGQSNTLCIVSIATAYLAPSSCIYIARVSAHKIQILCDQMIESSGKETLLTTHPENSYNLLTK